MAKTTVPGLYIADSAITAAKLNSTLDLTGKTITVATASSGDNDTTVASTAFVQQEIASLVDSSPSALNTLNELAAAIGDDANFSTTVTNSIATKLALAGGTMTGDLIINTTGALQIPVGTTAQRPTAATGQFRFNSSTSKAEIYDGSSWSDVGGGVESVNSATGVVTLDTDDISEGSTNLYFTNARADARIAAATTDDLTEGSTNLYFTTARANSAIDGRLSGSTGVTVSNGAISIGQDVATSTSPTFQNLTLSGTDSIKVPAGTTAQRSGSPANGMLRYNSTNGEFEGYQSGAWGALGGDTTSSVDLYTATGNGSTATYDTGKNPQSENNTWVFIGGVYQPKSTYSYSGTQITLSENLPNGEDLEVITGTVSTYNPTDAILGQYNATTSNTASYDTSLTTENENNVFVFIDGVYQPKSSYTYSGSTLTLDATPTSGMSLEVLVTRSMNAATVTTGFLADDAVTTAKITDANVTAAKLASSLDLTGKTITVATASSGDNDTSVASTAFVQQEITSLVDSAPATLNTLNELAAALGDDANFSTTVTNSIATKLPLAGGTLTGNLVLGDSVKAIFGAGSDLQIYSDGDNSFINEKSTTGSLFVEGDNIRFRTTDTSKTYALFTNSGSVRLYHNNSIHVETSSEGVDVTGNVHASGLLKVGTNDSEYANNYIRFKPAGAAYIDHNTVGQDINFRVSNASSLDTTALTIDSSGNLLVGTASTGAAAGGSGTSGININANGGVELARSANPVLFVNRTTSDGDIVQLRRDGSTVGTIGVVSTDRMYFSTADGLGLQFDKDNNRIIPCDAAGAYNNSVELGDSSLEFTNLWLSNNAYIGNALGIGTTSPQYKFDVSSTDDITMRIHRPSSGLAATDTCGIGFSQRGDTATSSSDTRAGIFSTYNGDLFLAVEAGGNLNSNPMDHSALFIEGSNGRVGIGTTAPSNKLHVAGVTNTDGIKIQGAQANVSLVIENDATNGVAWDISSTGGGHGYGDGALHFGVAFGEPKVKFQSDGKVGIGTNTPQNTLHIYGTGQTTANLAESGNQGGMLKITDANTAAGAGGAILFANYHADDEPSMGFAAIKGLLNNGSTYTQGSLAFSTRNAINGTSMTERMRLKYDGSFGIGTDNPDARLAVYASSVSGGVVKIKDTDATTSLGNTVLGLYFSNDDDCTNATFIGMYDSGSRIGSITVTNATSVAFNTTSDYRLKENVNYDFNALDRVAQLKPARFNWISDETNTTVDGFLAHEVQEIVPEAIHGEKDGVKEEEYEITPAVLDDDGFVVTEAEMGVREVPEYQGIDQSKLVPLLTKAIQELKTELDAAKARITELEG